MIKVNGLSVSRIPINGKETLRVMKNGQQLWSGTGLPAGYTLLEYIESTGAQYIDTGFKPNQDTRLIVDISNLGTNSSAVIGTRNQAAANASDAFNIYRYNSTRIRIDYFGSYKYLDISDTSPRTIMDINKNIATLYGQTLTLTPVTSKTSTHNLFLFAMNNLGSVALYAKLKMYSCQIYDNDILIRDFIPCINPNGIYGLYDKVNKQFYGSATSTPFTGA